MFFLSVGMSILPHIMSGVLFVPVRVSIMFHGMRRMLFLPMRVRIVFYMDFSTYKPFARW